MFSLEVFFSFKCNEERCIFLRQCSTLRLLTTMFSTEFNLLCTHYLVVRFSAAVNCSIVLNSRTSYSNLHFSVVKMKVFWGKMLHACAAVRISGDNHHAVYTGWEIGTDVVPLHLNQFNWELSKLTDNNSWWLEAWYWHASIRVHEP